MKLALEKRTGFEYDMKSYQGGVTKAPTEAPIFQSSGKTFRQVLKLLQMIEILNWWMSFEPDKVRLMKQLVSLEQLNMDIYRLY